MANQKVDQKMSVTQHLGALKKCLAIMLIVFAVAFAVCYYFAPEIVTFLLNINHNYSFQLDDVTEILAQYIKISLIAALVLDSPVIIWQIHSFVSPGLTKAEDTKFLMILVGGLAFFAIGDVFCYYVVIPFTLQFFNGLGNNLANTAAVIQLISLKNYVSYLVALLLAFGCIFEMPVIVAILSAIGLIKPKGMKAATSIVIVLCFVIGAAITPPDIMSQCMVAGPMIALYYVSIGICSVIYNRRRKKMIAEGLDPDEEEAAEAEEKKKTSRWASAAAQVELNDARKAKKK